MPRTRAFALIVVLFLVAMMAAGGASLGLIAGTESLLCRYAANDLSHNLSIDSLLKFLPELLRHSEANAAEEHAAHDMRQVALVVGDVQVRAWIRHESSKIPITGDNPDAIGSQLRHIAEVHQLDPEHVAVRPILPGDKRGAALQPFVWFDQLIEQQDFEEILPWAFDFEATDQHERRKPWSELITLWPGQDTQSLLVETVIGSDVRHWFLVVQIHDNRITVPYRGRI